MCLVVLIVIMMMMMVRMRVLMVMLMKTGGLCRSYAQTHPLQYSHLDMSFLLSRHQKIHFPHQ